MSQRPASPGRRSSSPRRARPSSPGRARPGSSPGKAADAGPAKPYREQLAAIEAKSTPKISPPTELGTRPQDAEFLEQNREGPGVFTLPCGLQYVVVKSAEPGAPSPKISTPCECHYRGKLLDGTEFDSSLARGKPSTFPPNAVIQGWTIALQLMGVGDKWVLTVPSALAYGDAGRRDDKRGQYIPAGAVLVFELELLSVQGPSKPKPQRPADMPNDCGPPAAAPRPEAPMAEAEAEPPEPEPVTVLFDRAPKQSARGPLSGMVMKAAAEADRTEFEQGTIEALRVMLSQLKLPTMRIALEDFGLPSDGSKVELAHRLTEALVLSAQREAAGLAAGGGKEN